MKKQLFKQLFRSTTVILACMAIFVNLFLGAAAFGKTGFINPMNNMDLPSEQDN